MARKKVVLTEEQKFQKFEQQKAKRYVKHLTNLHPDCTGCNIGRRWEPADCVLLIQSLRPKVTLSDLSLILERPVHGISSKLNDLGLARAVVEPRYVHVGSEAVSVKRKNVLPKGCLEALLKAGWKDAIYGGRLIAPSWWANYPLIKGRVMRAEE